MQEKLEINMNTNSKSLQTFVKFTKQLLAEDVKFKDFSEVAKFIILRQGQSDAVKMIALKGLAKIFKKLAEKDKSFSFTDADNKIIDVDLEKDNLETQFKQIVKLYPVNVAQTLNLDSIQTRISKLVNLSVVLASEEVFNVIRDLWILSGTSFTKRKEDQLVCIQIQLDEAVIYIKKNIFLKERPIILGSLVKMLSQEKLKFENFYTQKEKIKQLLLRTPEEEQEEKDFNDLYYDLYDGVPFFEPENFFDQFLGDIYR